MSAFHSNMLLGSAKTADLGDPIEQSLRFTGDSVLYRDFSNTATSTDTGTFSFWVKRSQLFAEQTIVNQITSAGNYVWFAAFPGATDQFAVRQHGGGWAYLTDTQFRDPSAWYHFVVSINNNTATVYINGTAHATTLTTDPTFTASGTDSVRIGSESTTAASSNLNGYLAEFIFVDGQALTPSSFGKTNEDGVWVPQNYTGSYGNRGFYLTFDPSGKAGQSGAGAGVGADHSPNNNHFDAYNFNTTSTTSIDYDVMPDTPTTNGITYLSAAPNDGYDGPYDANSTFDMTQPVLGSFPCTGGVDFDKNTGTYQIEYKVHSYYSNGPYVGACPADEFFTTTNLNVVGTTAAPLGFSYHVNGQKYQNGTNNAFGATFTTNDVIGLVFDTSSGEITAYKNGSSQGVIQNNCTGVWIPIGGAYGNAGGYMNFSSFVHPVSGTKPISTDSLGTQSIPDPSDHFRAIAAGPDTGVGAGELGGNWSTFLTPASGSWLASAGYDATGAFEGNAGNGAFPSACPSGTGPTGSLMTFAPDTDVAFTTLEVYMPNSGQNAKFDGTVTAVTNSSWTQVATNGTINKTTPLEMYANAGVYAYCQGIRINGNQILVDAGPLAAAQAAFPDGLWWIKDRDNSNQHQLVTNAFTNQDPVWIMPQSNPGWANYVPPTGDSVAWCWNAPDDFSADGTGGAQGDVACTGKINKAAGFSMIKFTNPTQAAKTIAHGLDKTPEFYVFAQNRGTTASTNASNKYTWHKDLTAGNYIYLDQAGAQTTNNFAGVINAVPTSSVFSIGNAFTANNGEFLALLWTSVPGYSAFGSYTGNSNLDNAFVYTGFKPAFVLIKSTAAAADWQIYDTTRSPNNPSEDFLSPNNQLAETTGFDIDILSNGFKLRSTNGPNATSSDCIYAAFAENPFGGTNTAPATAR